MSVQGDGGDYLTDRSRPSFGSRPAARGARNPIDPDSLPPPPSRSKGARNPFVVFGHAVVSLLFIAVLFAGGAAYFGSRELDQPGPLTQETTVLIPRGSGVGDIADALQNAGVIGSSLLFNAATRLTKASDGLKAGEYLFPANVSMRRVIEIISEGKGIQHAITIPEGLTSQAIVERLAQDDVLTGESPAVPREGALLPDTYKFERGTSRAQLLARMEAEQKQALEEIWKRRSPNLPLKSPSELVTLASIVEKETGRADERSRVAKVFINRLQKNMRLQSDPTVIYGIAGGKGKLDRPIQRADLDAPTPYNTYVIPGLPPGPIANPGRAAMEAVANPSETGDLYFVADGTGGHAFAATLDEHNRNVSRWRQASAAAAAAAAAQSAPAPAPNASQAAAPEPQAAPAPQTATAATPPAAGAASQAQGAGQPQAHAAAAAAPATFDPARQPARNGGKQRTFQGAAMDKPPAQDPLQDTTFDLNSPQVVPSTD